MNKIRREVFTILYAKRRKKFTTLLIIGILQL